MDKGNVERTRTTVRYDNGKKNMDGKQKMPFSKPAESIPIEARLYYMLARVSSPLVTDETEEYSLKRVMMVY